MTSPPGTTDPTTIPVAARRRSTDGFFGHVRVFTTTLLPPALCIYLAILLGKVVLLDKDHDFNWPMVAICGMILAAAFGPNMFEKWMDHRETMGGK